MRSVARAADVTISVAEPLKGKHGIGPSSATGTWTAASPAVEPHESMVNGQALLAAVTCAFTFVGKLDSDTTVVVNGSASLRLEPDATKLRVGGESVLCDGDEVEDDFENVIRIKSSARLRSG